MTDVITDPKILAARTAATGPAATGPAASWPAASGSRVLSSERAASGGCAASRE